MSSFDKPSRGDTAAIVVLRAPTVDWILLSPVSAAKDNEKITLSIHGDFEGTVTVNCKKRDLGLQETIPIGSRDENSDDSVKMEFVKAIGQTVETIKTLKIDNKKDDQNETAATTASHKEETDATASRKDDIKTNKEYFIGCNEVTQNESKFKTDDDDLSSESIANQEDIMTSKKEQVKDANNTSLESQSNDIDHSDESSEGTVFDYELSQQQNF